MTTNADFLTVQFYRRAGLRGALTRSRLVLAAVLLSLAAPAWAKARLAISITQAKEIVEVKNGARSVRLVPVQAASPGDILQFTLNYTNAGDEAATDAVLDDAIPKGTTFVATVATDEGTQVSFSSDGGKTFAPPVKLTYEIRLPSGAVEKRIATPAEYTHVRWTIKRVPPGATGKVAFRVRVS